MNMKIGDTFALAADYLITGKLSGSTKLQARVVGVHGNTAHLWVTKNGIRLLELDAVVENGKPTMKEHK